MSKFMRSAISLVFYVLPLSLLVLSACGGGGGGGGGAFTPVMQFSSSGGVMVSTFSGTANSGADGTGTAARFQGPNNAVSDGTNLYVADTHNHTIRKIVISTGAVSTLAGQAGVTGAADGTGTSATFNNPTGITIDNTNANLYVTDTGNNKIRKILISTGAVTSLTGMANTAVAASAVDGPGTAASFNGSRGITIIGSTLYVADTGNNKIRSVDSGTGFVSSLTGSSNIAAASGVLDGSFFNATFNAPAGIAAVGTSLYVADTGNNKIRKVDTVAVSASSLTGVINTLAASGALDGAAASAAFAAPAGIGTDGTNLFVADTGNNKIRQVTIGSLTVSSLTGASSVSVTAGYADGAASSVSFSAPAGIAFSANTIYVVDAGNNTVRSYSLGSLLTSTLAGSPLLNTGANGTGAVARYKLPGAVVSDGINLYVADTGNHTIRQIVISTGAATTLAGQSGVAGAADGTGAAATFNNPVGLAIGGGNLYVADSGNNKIRVVTISGGTVTSLTGVASSAAASGVQDGPASLATFNNPSGIATDGVNLYVADTGNNKIRQITISSPTATSLTGASSVAAGVGAADGAASSVSFSAPFGIVIDPAKTSLYVADTGNNKIRQIVIATGAASSVTGASGVAVTAGAADGAGSSASMNSPRGIATDGVSLYVADAGNNKIRQVTIAGALVSSVTGAANAAGAAGYADGLPAAATFSGPYGIAAVGASLYVVDRGNSVIRRIQ
jgi:sugar lactone lactonase YvrE